MTCTNGTVKAPAHDAGVRPFSSLFERSRELGGGGRLVATVTDPDGNVPELLRSSRGDPMAPATPYRWFRISPRRIQAWREVNELPDRELMRGGRWLV